MPSDELGREDEDGEADGAAGENGGAPAKKRTRRGSRGGKNRRKPGAAAAVAGNGGEPAEDAVEEVAEDGFDEAAAETPLSAAEEPETTPQPVEPSENGAPEDDWGYVPMSEWGDELKYGFRYTARRSRAPGARVFHAYELRDHHRRR